MQMDANEAECDRVSSKSHGLTRRDLILLFGTMAAFLVAIIPLAMSVHVLEYDEAVFMDVARNIQRWGIAFRSVGEHGQPFFDHTPAYLYLLSLYADSSEAGILGARLVTAAIGLGCVWLAFAIGKHIRDSSAGFVAALLLAINSFFAIHAFFVRMEVPMVFAMLCGLFLLLKSEHGQRTGLIVASGVLLAIASLFKEFAILFTGWCVIYVALVCERRRWPFVSALLVLPSVLGLILWIGWARRLSTAAFIIALRRWADSMVAINLLDPRARIGAGQWAQQITFDLLGAALVVGLVVSLIAAMAQRKARLSPVQFLLWGYLLSALGVSFLIRLKEPRHLIGVLPMGTLVIGTTVDWEGLIQRVWSSGRALPRALFVLAAAVFLLAASPLRLPSGPITSVGAWLDPLYGWRVQENDRFYNVLRLAGQYLREQTDPAEVITVAHQASVTAY